MKKTLTVNLGGTVFHIDEDAYRLLDNYLKNLKAHFRKEQGVEEIVDDMETRIAELFAEKKSTNSQVITLADVEEVIARMGKPEDFDEPINAETADNGSSERRKDGRESGQTNARRRFYRDPDNKMLGGVAGGVAAYFDWDVTLVRLVLVLLVFLPYCPVVLPYLIAWFLIPEAHTATEKLNMRGEPVTVESIGKTVTDGFERMANDVNRYMNSDKPRTLLQQIGDVAVAVIGAFLKLILLLLAVACAPVLFAFVVVFVLLIVALVTFVFSGTIYLVDWLPAIQWELPLASPLWNILGAMGGVILLGIPLGGLVYGLLCRVFQWQPMGTALKWSLFILWLIGVGLVAGYYLSVPDWEQFFYGLG